MQLALEDEDEDLDLEDDIARARKLPSSYASPAEQPLEPDVLPGAVSAAKHKQQAPMDLLTGDDQGTGPGARESATQKESAAQAEAPQGETAEGDLAHTGELQSGEGTQVLRMSLGQRSCTLVCSQAQAGLQRKDMPGQSSRLAVCSVCPAGRANGGMMRMSHGSPQAVDLFAQATVLEDGPLDTVPAFS